MLSLRCLGRSSVAGSGAAAAAGPWHLCRSLKLRLRRTVKTFSGALTAADSRPATERSRTRLRTTAAQRSGPSALHTGAVARCMQSCWHAVQHSRTRTSICHICSTAARSLPHPSSNSAASDVLSRPRLPSAAAGKRRSLPTAFLAASAAFVRHASTPREHGTASRIAAAVLWPVQVAAASPSLRRHAPVSPPWWRQPVAAVASRPRGPWGAAAVVCGSAAREPGAPQGLQEAAASVLLRLHCCPRYCGCMRRNEAGRSGCIHTGAAAAHWQQELRRPRVAAAAAQQQQMATGNCSVGATVAAPQQQLCCRSYCTLEGACGRTAAIAAAPAEQHTGRAYFTTKREEGQMEEEEEEKAGSPKIVLTPKLVLRRPPNATTRFPTTLKEGADVVLCSEVVSSAYQMSPFLPDVPALSQRPQTSTDPHPHPLLCTREYAVLPAQPIPLHIQRPPYACTAGGVYPVRSSRSKSEDKAAARAESAAQRRGTTAAAAAASSPRRTVSAAETSTVEEETEEEQEEEEAFAPVQPPRAQEKLRRAALVAANALELCMRAAREGVTTEDLDRIAHEYIISVGAYPAAVNFHNFPKAICTSVNEVACHGIPDLRPLQNGDIVSIDCTSYLDGYFGDCAATAMVGEVLPQHRKLVEASKEALETAIKMVKPGLPIAEVGRYTSQVAHAYGFSVVREFSGHFIGRKLHLPPLVSHVYPNSTEGVFRVGQTLTIEPILCEGAPDVFSWKDGWSIATQDGGRSAQFEHTLLVTEDGAVVLTVPSI